MPQTEISTLQGRVSDVASRSALSGSLEHITVEADRDNEGSDFLRRTVRLDAIDDVRDKDLEALVGAIEESVAEVDDRFPSVRFFAEA